MVRRWALQSSTTACLSGDCGIKQKPSARPLLRPFLHWLNAVSQFPDSTASLAFRRFTTHTRPPLPACRQTLHLSSSNDTINWRARKVRCRSIGFAKPLPVAAPINTKDSRQPTSAPPTTPGPPEPVRLPRGWRVPSARPRLRTLLLLQRSFVAEKITSSLPDASEAAQPPPASSARGSCFPASPRSSRPAGCLRRNAHLYH